MCDVYRPTLTHITPEIMPPTLTIAERDGTSGRDLLVERVSRVGVFLDKPIAEMHGIFPRYKAKFEALLSGRYIAAAIPHDREANAGSVRSGPLQ